MTDHLTPQQQALIGRLYDAALDETLWRALCTDMMAAFGDASDVVIMLNRHHSLRLVCDSPHVNDEALRAYEAYYWQHDIWIKLARKLGVGHIHSSAEHIGARELEGTEFYADFCRPIDLYHVIGGALPLSTGETALLGVHRQRSQGPFADGQALKAQLQALAPHLQRALQISSRLARSNLAERNARAALDCLDTAVLLIDAKLEVQYANACAMTLFAPDLPRKLHSHLAPGSSDPRDIRWSMLPQLAQGIRQAIAGTPPQAHELRLARLPGPDLFLSVVPFKVEHGPFCQQACAMLLARNPDQAPAEAHMLQRLFALTPAEAQVCQALARGNAIDSIAAGAHISINTVKTHLHHIYDKTDTARQGQLIALLHQCATGALAAKRLTANSLPPRQG
ncbi:helix-turn-helix transcriptional regulator [Janthinobacterium sp. RB2R34]|uniref:helix-turn-helix transcriptional regulator n=1 Tax=Janthinobacterium sp. RB2R34 TaxID=3424193 RepID=UPI003F20C80B